MKINIPALKKEPGVSVDEAHDWGYQVRLVNNERYCAKFLVLTNGTHGSLHSHSLKDETFIVLSGEVFLKFGKSVGLLKVGDQIRLEPGVPHERWAQVIPSVVLEVSTHDDDLDYTPIINALTENDLT